MTRLGWRRARDYASGFSGTWHSVYGRQATGFPSPVSIGPDKIDFGDRIAPFYPELGVFELPMGFVLSPHGWAIGRNNLLLPEFSWYGDHVSEMKFPQIAPKGVHIEGRVLSLLSDWSSINYGHLLLDSLSRLHLFQAAGFSIDELAGVLCPGAHNARTAAFLDRLGIPAQKRIWARSAPWFKADEFILTSFPGVRRVYPKWSSDFLRDNLGTTPTRSDRRLYISRGTGTRKIINEDALQPILDKFGFENYNPAEHSYPPADFGEADIVVGAHGAGLTDIVFCPPGAKVLELIPSDHVYPHYFTLAESSSLNYRAILGKSTVERSRDAWEPSPHDFSVDVGLFEQALTGLLDIPHGSTGSAWRNQPI